METIKPRLLLVALAFALAACGTSVTPTPARTAAAPLPANAVIAEGRLVPARDATLAFQARGTVAEVRVKIGDKVKGGDLLAILGGPNDAGYAAARAEIFVAQQAFDDFLSGASLVSAQAWQRYLDAQVARAAAERRWEGLNLDAIERRIENAEEEIRDREENLQEAQERWEKYKGLSESDWRRQDAENKLEEAQEEYNEALRKLESIQRERDSVRAALDVALAIEAQAYDDYENTSDGIDLQQFEIIKARLDAAIAAEAAYRIIAPFDGTVMDVNVAVGEQVGPERWAVKVADTSAWYVETTDLTELEVVKIMVGQKVSILPDALPDAQMTGVVESISQAFTMQGGDILYRVKIKVDEVDPRVLWGMTVEVTFEALE